ncbi:MAG: hypothetical protein OZ914_00230 [Anaerolineaceae bacterium]|nr:hypothetical protein [Anaerolineaceae bacterium]
MTRLQIILLLTLILLAGLIPVTIYLMEGNSLTRDIASLPTREMPLREQAAQALAGLVIKPIYMMLCLAVIVALIGQTRPALVVLMWGQAAFLVGEIFCAINFYVYRHESLISEYLHSFGMALAFGLTLLALIEWVEMLTNAQRKPLFLKEIRAFTLFALPIFVVLTFIPLLAPLQTDAYTTTIFNFSYSYTRFEAYEIYERRVLPTLSMIIFIITFIYLLNGPSVMPFRAKAMLCAGLGALGFAYFRIALNAIFAENLVWFEFWEEATELMFVGGVAFALWRFRFLLKKTPLLSMFLAEKNT